MNRIFPVIVIYKVQLCEATAYREFLRQVPAEAFMVYDNSPESFAQDMQRMPATAIYVRDTSNGGLSVAYNRAARYAQEHGYNRVLLLDEDTRFPVEMFSLMQNCASAVCVPRVVLGSGVPFSPCRWHRGVIRGVRLQPGTYRLADFLLINSGLCVAVDSFWKAGGYNEQVRLDFADYQFVCRLRRVEQFFTVLGCEATQHFSNDIADPDRLYARFLHFLDGARHVEGDGLLVKAKISWLVLLHTMALAHRTRQGRFLWAWLHRFLLRVS